MIELVVIAAMLLLYGLARLTYTPASPPADEAALDLRALVRDRVAVHTTDGQSVAGYVEATLPDAIVLDPADWMNNGHAHPVGRVVVALDRVAWVQLLPPLDAPAVDPVAVRGDDA